MANDGNKDGSITVHPVVAYGVDLLAESSVLLLVQFVHSEAELEARVLREVRFGLTPPIARALAAALQKAASLADTVPPGTPLQ